MRIGLGRVKGIAIACALIAVFVVLVEKTGSPSAATRGGGHYLIGHAQTVPQPDDRSVTDFHDDYAEFATGRETPISHRAVARPGQRIPYFAPRAGRLPSSGPGRRVAGVALPAGRPTPHYWMSVAPLDLDRARQLAGALADAFPRTGLWPVLWDWDDEGPAGYAQMGGRLSTVARQDPLAVLGRMTGGVRTLAPAGQLPAHTANPFLVGTTEPLARYVPGLMLVPVNRPADVVDVTGVAWSGLLSLAAQTAVARSFEERYGAVVTTLSPGGFTMVASAPPQGDAATRTLAAEQKAYTDGNGGESDAELLARLRGPAPQVWSFGWDD